ncbi:MAG: hypothetical protein GF350_16860 [Chitinivibrionales bacterium]|nr:hypothetical protein [Chitinivibrionales bacterium]
MIILDILTALLIAALLTAIFSFALRIARTKEILFFFFILFLATWAGGLWLVPFGPYLWGIRIFPFLFFALVIALLLAGFSHPWYRPRTRGEALRQSDIQRDERVIINGLLWTLIVFLVVAIFVRYSSTGYMINRRL